MTKHLFKTIFFLMLVIAGNYAFSQSTTVTGTVTAKEDGGPIPGATVKIKGSTIGTQTNISGKFTLNVSPNAVLVFSFLGYETQQVTANKPVINVSLNLSNSQLNEVVVTGTGTGVSKAKLGISVEAVSGSDLAPTPEASIDQGLVGKIPGAQISSVDGTPGARTNIVLRGINTVQGGTQPMYLVDGVQSAVTDISQLDPATIDHIEIVQGAASSTIYGAQGANGVIQIFTKKGKAGKAKIDVASSVTSSNYINQGGVYQAKLSSFLTNSAGQFVTSSGTPIALNSDGTYSGLSWAYGANSAAGDPTAMSNPLNIYHQQYGTNLQWYNHLAQLFQTAYTTNNSATISGGSDKSDYSITVSNNHQQSNIRTNGYVDRSNLTTNLGTELFKGFTIRSTTQIIYTDNTLNPFYQSGGNAIYDALNASPYYNFNQKLADGTYPFTLTSGTVSVNGHNPFYYTEYSSGVSNREDLLQSFQADYKINSFVELNAKYGINYGHNETTNIYQNQTGNANSTDYNTWIYYNNANDNTGELDKYDYNEIFQNFNVSAIIRTDFKKDFHINVPITTNTLLEFDNRKDTQKSFDTYGYSLPTYAIYNFQQTQTQQVFYDNTTPFNTYGFVVNQKIDIGDYGGVTGGFRSDYSSAFGEGSKPFTFPAGNGYLRLSSFNFWKNGSLGNLFPEFKLRGGYGEAGIQPFPFDRYPTINPSNLGSSLVFSNPSNLANADLEVEVDKEWEIGTDFEIKGFSGNWFPDFNISGTYWNRTSSNSIYNVSVAPSSGGTTKKTNAIALASHGVQASLNVAILRQKDFNWNFTTNFSNETTIITSIAGPQIILTSAAGSTAETLVAGQQIGQIYGYKALTSLNETNQQGVPYIDPVNYSQYSIVDGRVVNNATKAIQFTNQVYPLASPNPKFNTSFINNFNYKKLNFGFQFDWVYGSHLYNQTKEWMYRDGISGDYDKAVDIDGTSAAYVAYYRSAYADVFGARNGARDGTKDYFLEDASFGRLRNLYLGYDFTNLLGSKVFRKAVLTVSARNILTITKYTGFDPEISSGTSNSPFDRGVDHDSMPNLKSYTLGLSLGF